MYMILGSIELAVHHCYIQTRDSCSSMSAIVHQMCSAFSQQLVLIRRVLYNECCDAIVMYVDGALL